MKKRIAVLVVFLICIASVGFIWRYFVNVPTEEIVPYADVPDMPAPQPTPELPQIIVIEPAEEQPPLPIPRDIREEFALLREQYDNDDIVGRIVIEGTSVNYLVTQTGDNEFYLHHDINKTPNQAGWVFLDFENNIARQDRNTIIYGHNMREDIRFHSLRRFLCEEFFNDNRYVILNTLYDDYIWEIFAFYITDTDFRYLQVIFPTQADFYGLATEMKARSMHDSEIIVTADDRILTLSTCVGADNLRYVLNARLIQ